MTVYMKYEAYCFSPYIVHTHTPTHRWLSICVTASVTLINFGHGNDGGRCKCAWENVLIYAQMRLFSVNQKYVTFSVIRMDLHIIKHHTLTHTHTAKSNSIQSLSHKCRLSKAHKLSFILVFICLQHSASFWAQLMYTWVCHQIFSKLIEI